MNIFKKLKIWNNKENNPNIYSKSSLKINIKNKIVFLDQLSNLINSSIPITNSLKIISYQTRNKKVKRMVLELIEKTNQWLWLKDAFSCYYKIFSTFDLSIIEMWEVTWKIWDSIDIIKNKEEKDKEIRWKIVWALIYPAVIIVLSISMILVFMLFVIPKIQDMYKSAKVNLPWLTQSVINTSNFLQEHFTSLIIWLIWIIILFIIFKNSKYTKIYFDKYLLKMPLFWWLIKKKILSLFASSLWTLLSSWVIINKSLEIASKSLENAYYEKEVAKIIEWISKWLDLSTLMWINDITKWKENAYFPIEFSSVVKIWEQTWKTSDLLLKLSVKFNKEIDVFVKNLQTAIEPIVIIWVWLIVWTLIMAIMLPFFNMVKVI